MVWFRGKDCYYSFRGDESGYQLMITDFKAVLEEYLGAEEVRVRSERLNSIIDVSAPKQVAKFCSILGGLVEKHPLSCIESVQTVSEDLADGSKLMWEFHAKCCSGTRSGEILAQLFDQLLVVVGKLNDELVEGQSEVSKREFHIRRMAEMLGSAYDPLQYRDAYQSSIANETKQTFSNNQSPMEIAAKYWPLQPPLKRTLSQRESLETEFHEVKNEGVKRETTEAEKLVRKVKKPSRLKF